MQFIGEDPVGRKWFFADDSFTEPGIYYWNGKENVNVIKELDELKRKHAASLKTIDELNQAAVDADF